jgi:hypothetical protein
VKNAEANAFCLPGGKIVVNEGILPITQTEEGLAVVLGHEVAHAVAKHSAERLSQQMVMQYGGQALDVILSGKTTQTRQLAQTVYGLGAQYGSCSLIRVPTKTKPTKRALSSLPWPVTTRSCVSFWHACLHKGHKKYLSL